MLPAPHPAPSVRLFQASARQCTTPTTRWRRTINESCCCRCQRRPRYRPRGRSLPYCCSQMPQSSRLPSSPMADAGLAFGASTCDAPPLWLHSAPDVGLPIGKGDPRTRADHAPERAVAMQLGISQPAAGRRDRGRCCFAGTSRSITTLQTCRKDAETIPSSWRERPFPTCIRNRSAI